MIPYNAYLTPTFAEVFEDNLQLFVEEWEGTTFSDHTQFQDEDLIYFIYTLLNAKYRNSHILSTDTEQFKSQLFSIIFQYAPTWERKLKLQESLRNLSEEDILTSSRQIVNHASNPSTSPNTSTLEALPFIDSQTSSGYKKNKIDAYTLLYQVLEDDITEEFLLRFKKLFMAIAYPNVQSITQQEQE